MIFPGLGPPQQILSKYFWWRFLRIRHHSFFQFYGNSEGTPPPLLPLLPPGVQVFFVISKHDLSQPAWMTTGMVPQSCCTPFLGISTRSQQTFRVIFDPSSASSKNGSTSCVLCNRYMYPPRYNTTIIIIIIRHHHHYHHCRRHHHHHHHSSSSSN